MEIGASSLWLSPGQPENSVRRHTKLEWLSASEGIRFQRFVTGAVVEVRVFQTYLQLIFMVTVNLEPGPRRTAPGHPCSSPPPPAESTVGLGAAFSSQVHAPLESALDAAIGNAGQLGGVRNGPSQRLGHRDENRGCLGLLDTLM